MEIWYPPVHRQVQTIHIENIKQARHLLLEIQIQLTYILRFRLRLESIRLPKCCQTSYGSRLVHM